MTYREIAIQFYDFSFLFDNLHYKIEGKAYYINHNPASAAERITVKRKD
jgi:hypothetical protein